jgi:hypothetical protein
MRRALAALVALPLLCTALLRAQAPGFDVSAKALVAAAARYVADYEQAFLFLVADETYEQVSNNLANDVLTRRVMRGELFLTFLPADDEWIAVHDIAVVDGEPVTDREDLRVLLQRRDTLRGVASRIAARNARFNIGGVTRNFNEPTLPLLLLHAKRINGVKFEVVRLEREGGTTLATLQFTERDRPTLVTGSSGPAPATGLIVIEADTGRVRHTLFSLKDRATTVTLETFYAHDRNVDLWVPTRFTERYDTNVGPLHEAVTCEAVYQNYRRFDVTSRIK